MNENISIFDTTLRDGSQGEEISFSVEDKLAIAEKLDEFGVDYIEGGWPFSGVNAKDVEFFHRAKKLNLKHATLVAFGSTRRARHKVEEDPGLAGLVEAGTPAVCIFGKSWDFHATEVLGVSLEENLRMIQESVAFLKSKKKEVIYDAEHFFDGYRRNPSYALQTLKAAVDARADWVVLCDTNGGSLPEEVARVVAEVGAQFQGAKLGIHCHNDAELAVANTLAAVRQGVRQVQGTINGLGERCGNANLISLIPNLRMKLGFSMRRINDKSLTRLTELSRFVSTVANTGVDDHQAYVGFSAFAHKAGVHSHAVTKTPLSYEHVRPETVGNARRVLISEQAGAASVLTKAQQFGYKLEKDSPQTRQVIEKVKQLELQGYQFEGADASFQLLLRKVMGTHRRFFELESYHVTASRRGPENPLAEATIKVTVKGERRHTVAEGNGPVNALDNALRKALADFYPGLARTHLVDFKVRVLNAKEATASRVRVLMETSDGGETWCTVGVHENIIEACWEALVDSLEYKLLKDKAK